MNDFHFQNQKSPLRLAGIKIIGTGLFLGIVFVCFSGFLAYEYIGNTRQQRLEQLKQTVQIARNAIEPILVRYRSQQTDILETLNQVRDLVRNMTYNDHAGKNYIFMSAYDGIMLVQPFEPEKEMTDMWNLKDANGIYIIKALVEVAKSEQGSGYISYHYKRPGKAEPEEKISYVMGIPELGCYIGTGQYVGDIRKDQINYIVRIVALTSTLLLFLSVLVWLSMKVISKQNQILYKENKALILAEKSLSETGRFLETVINHIPDQIFWKNEALEYIGCNKSFSQVVGLDHPDDVAGMTDYDFSRDKTHAESYRKWDKQIIDSGKAVINLEEKFHDNEGNEGTVITSKVPVYNEKGNCICLVGICTDITQRKLVEIKLKKALEDVKALSGLLPICSRCKKVRDDKGYWNDLEAYIEEHSDASFSHSMCIECSEELYGEEEWYIKMRENKKK